MDNIYEKSPLEIIVLNPFTLKSKNKILIPQQKIKGGTKNVHHTTRNFLQNADIAAFDKDITELRNIKKYEDECQIKGCPDSVMIYPYTNIKELRYKIYIATGIHPYRQHILMSNNNGIISSCYSFFIGQNMIEINIFNQLQQITDNQILNVPFDVSIVNSKQDIKVEMYDTFLTLQTNEKNYIKKVMVCDLYDILNPKDENLTNILVNQYQKDIIYYGIIIKFFPIISYDVFEQIFITKDSVSHIYPYLSPSYNKLKSLCILEKEVINESYNLIDKSITYMKTISKRTDYIITEAEIEVKIPLLDIRNLFDMLELDSNFVFSSVKLMINGKIFIADKKYTLYKERIRVSMHKIDINTMLLITKEGIKIKIYKKAITLKLKYNENEGIQFSDLYCTARKVINKLLDQINTFGITVIKESGYIDKKIMDIEILTSNVIMYWPENFTTEQFFKLRTELIILEDINMISVINSLMGVIDCRIRFGSVILNPIRMFNLMHHFPIINNQYEYYRNTDFRDRWNDLFKKTISFTQRASNTMLTFINFNEKSFIEMKYLILSFLYTFSKKLRKQKTIVYKEEIINKHTKNLRKLKGVDPELFDIKRHDPKYQVYSIKCQSDRQPVIYQPHELSYLSRTIQSRLIKFWNFTEKKPVYYDCPNKKYRHLSFRPQDHPLGYCMPCCKQLISSINSRQSKIDKICIRDYEIPHKDIEKIIKKLEIESTHIFTYGKEIPIGRISRIPNIIENGILMNKTQYRLVGVKQYLPNFRDAGFIYSIINILQISLTLFIKDITSIINEKLLQILDAGSTAIFHSADHLKEILINLLIDTPKKNINTNTDNVDWINVLSELVFIFYNKHILVIIDYDDDISFRMLNTSQICLLEQDCTTDYIIICAHDAGIYPLYLMDNKNIGTFHHDDALIKIFSEITKQESEKIKNIGTSLVDIFNFIKNTKKYKIEKLLRGKRGLIYATILNNNNKLIYVPCLYSEFITGSLKIKITNIPVDYNNFSRQKMYEFIDDYNSFVIKQTQKDKEKIIAILDPYATIKYNNKYIGIRIKYINNKFGTTFYHAPESTEGRYKLTVINYAYDIRDINNAIQKPSTSEVYKEVGKYLYQNYVYTLFMIEFGYIVRKNRNQKIRNNLIDILSSKLLVDRRKIGQLLKDYSSDYKTIIRLLTLYHQSKVLNLIPNILFDFDKIVLTKLRQLDTKNRLLEIKKLMKDYVFIQSTLPSISNIISSCKGDTKLPQCKNNRLIITEKDFNKCCELLNKDLKNPFIYETISLNTSIVRNSLDFINRPTEILHIQDYEY